MPYLVRHDVSVKLFLLLNLFIQTISVEGGRLAGSSGRRRGEGGVVSFEAGVLSNNLTRLRYPFTHTVKVKIHVRLALSLIHI